MTLTIAQSNRSKQGCSSLALVQAPDLTRIQITSLPLTGRPGMFCDRISEPTAKPVPIKNTAELDTTQTSPSAAGITTAAIWLIVNDTPAVLAMSSGLAIFWK